ncbi:MAG: ATP-binding cassette domain-containing protein [Actinomycetia bacterium]|nr:ATP-binding cassette domain-containing protein [Actinomycetes bacterium]
MKSIVSVNDLVKRFNGLTAVDGVSFEVEQGEVFGFLGPNGAGKTTTINMLCTLLGPTSGSALVNGYDISSQRNEVRESIGLVFQDPSLDDKLSAYENLEFHARVYHVPRRLRQDRIREVLEIVSLTDRAGDWVETFSGGMKRRLEIARGLIHYPRVLFLDEPTIGLDPQTRNHIWEYINRLKESEGITIFMTTHYMEEAENCDRIAIIDNGKIIALDTPEELKNNIGAHVIKLKTVDDRLAAKELVERYRSVEMMPDPDCLCFKTEKAEEFIPDFIRDFPVRILSINVHRPTLDDVFLALTGREIRKEGADELAGMRTFMAGFKKSGR